MIESHVLSTESYIRTIMKMVDLSDSALKAEVKESLQKKKELPEIDPSSYDHPSTYYRDKQLLSLLSKNESISFGKDTKAAGLKKALEAEKQCLQTNIRLKNLSSHEANSWKLIHDVRHFVKSILGSFDWSETKPDFGPGSTSVLRGSRANIVSKLGNLPECTAYGHDRVLLEILDKMPLYAISSGIVTRERTSVSLAVRHLPIVDFDKIHFVKKNYKTDRAIFVGPMGNTMVQKGIGSLIRAKLRKYGLNLDKVAPLHGEYARIGSIDGSIATIDLASASDTLSIEAVRLLLPEDWFDALDSVRVKRSDYGDGKPIFNEKFSAMGNGFTWELESLIFYAIVLAVRHRYGSRSNIVSVFGDDICVSTNLTNHVLDYLTFFGFIVNNDKTFTDGPFRESCGFDYFKGTLVTPTYFRGYDERIHQIENTYIFLNRIRKMAHRNNNYCGCDSLYRAIWQDLYKGLPKQFQLFGTETYGDTVILAGYRGYRGKHLARKSKRIKPKPLKDLVLSCALYGVPSEGVSPRGAFFKLQVTSGLPEKQTLWLNWI